MLGFGATVTVAVPCCVPPGPVATRVYVVVCVTVTLCEPLVATAAPFSVTEVAFCVCQETVLGWPAATVVGSAEICSVGAETGFVELGGCVPAATSLGAPAQAHWRTSRIAANIVRRAFVQMSARKGNILLLRAICFWHVRLGCTLASRGLPANQGQQRPGLTCEQQAFRNVTSGVSSETCRACRRRGFRERSLCRRREARPFRCGFRQRGSARGLFCGLPNRWR